MGGAIRAVIGVATVAAGLITGNPFLIKAGLALTLSGASQLLAPKPKALGQDISFSERHQKRIQTIRSPTAPRRVIYGADRVSGPLVAVFSTGSDNKYLHMFMCLAGHECSSVGDIWLNDKLSTDSKFSGKVRINIHLGASDQLADTDAVSEISEWTTNHRLRGICYLYIRLQWDQDVWIGGLPNITAKTKGKKIYDPRGPVTTWSDNPILCERDYLLNEFKADSTAMDETVGNANANVCDELVPVEPSGTQKRYLCNGSFTKDMKPIDIMEELRSSCAGTNIRQQGKYKLYAGAFTTPTITLTESDLRDDMQLQTKDSRKDLFNAVKGEFVDPDDFYMPTSFPPLVNSTFETEDGGMRIFKDIELAFTTNIKMAQRISKIHLERGRQGVKVFFPAKMTAFQLAAWDTVYLTIARLNWTAKSFRILKWSMSIDGGIDLELQEDSAAAWGWTSAEEQSIPTPPDMPVPDPGTVAAPGGLTLTSGAPELVQKSDGTIISRIKASWTLTNEEFVLSGGHHEIQFKPSAGGTWFHAVSVPGNVNQGWVTDVDDGVNYDVRVKAVNSQDASSAWATSINHTVVGQTNSPSIPTGLTATALITAVELKWTANPEFNIAGYDVQRAEDSGFTVNVSIITRTDTLTHRDEQLAAGVTRYYRIRAVRRSSESSPSGWTNAVVTTTIGAGTAVIDDEAITEAKLSDNAVTANKIAADAIIASKIKAGEINSGHLTVATAVITNVIQIADALITNAKIANVDADKLNANTTIANLIKMGDDKFQLDGPNRYVLIKDNQGTPQNRVKLGKTGPGSTDYGIQIWDNNGNVMLDVNGVKTKGLVAEAAAKSDFASTDGTIYCRKDGTWTTIQTLVFNAAGEGKIIIFGKAHLNQRSGWIRPQMKLTLGGTTKDLWSLGSSTNSEEWDVMLMFVGTSGTSGNITVKLEVYPDIWTTEIDAQNNGIDATYRKIWIEESKR